MNITELSLKKPVIPIVLSLCLVLFGLIMYIRIPIQKLPNVPVPLFIITTELPGASAKQVDKDITQPIQNAVSGMSNVKRFFSTTYPGISIFKVQFFLGQNRVKVFQEIQARVNKIVKELPKGASRPTIQQFEISDDPIVWLVLQDKNNQLSTLTEYAKNTIKPKLTPIPGVGDITFAGLQPNIVRISLDPDKMSAHGINIQQVMQALNNENANVPGGVIVDHHKQYVLNMDLTFQSLDHIKNMIVAVRQGGAVIRLSQIAQVNLSPERALESARFNGKPGVGIGIIRQNNANTINVIQRVRNTIKHEINPTLPPGMQLKIALDNARPIIESLRGLKHAIFYALLFAALIVWIFLKNMRATLIIVAAIPISLYGTIIALDLANYTINMLTLLSLILLVGVVVDDAIIVLENIYRHRDAGDARGDALTLSGTKEVMLPVISATLTLIIIFTAVVVMKGLISVFFHAFAVTITVGVLISLFVSLSLTPLLAKYFLNGKSHNRVYYFFDRITGSLRTGYRSALNVCLRYQWFVVLATLIFITPIYFIGHKAGFGLLPRFENHANLLISIKTPQNSSIAYTEQQLKVVETRLMQNPNSLSVFSTIPKHQVNTAKIYLQLKPSAIRTTPSYTLINYWHKALNTIPGIQVSVKEAPINSKVRQPVWIGITGPSMESATSMGQAVKHEMQNDPTFGIIESNAQNEQTQFRLKINRTLANDRGISAKALSQTVALFGGQIKVGRFAPPNTGDTSYDIYLEPKKDSLLNPSDLDKIYINTRNHQAIPISAIATLEKTQEPSAVNRVNLKYAVMLQATPTTPLDQAITRIKQITNKLFTKGHTLIIMGQAYEADAAAQSAFYGLLIALVMLYIILAIQFNSMIQPLLILIAQPLAIAGAVYTLFLCNMTINIFSIIGILLLLGLVTKNSILLISLTNIYRQRGQSIIEALKAACPLRIIPVMMTSLTLILAMIPVLFSTGEGSRDQHVLATTIIAGVTVSTILSLIVVPPFYAIVETASAWCRHKLQRKNT